MKMQIMFSTESGHITNNRDTQDEIQYNIDNGIAFPVRSPRTIIAEAEQKRQELKAEATRSISEMVQDFEALGKQNADFAECMIQENAKHDNQSKQKAGTIAAQE